jgi:hypothetical protein
VIEAYTMPDKPKKRIEVIVEAGQKIERVVEF